MPVLIITALVAGLWCLPLGGLALLLGNPTAAIGFAMGGLALCWWSNGACVAFVEDES